MNTTPTKQIPSPRYIPLENDHIAPLTGVTPDDVKKASKDVIRDRAKTKATNLQNEIASRLGFTGAQGNFAAFRKEYETELLPFMKKNKLERLTDLATPRFDYRIIKLSHRAISDRLFCSGKPFPKRIFTGYNLDWNTLTGPYHTSRNIWRHPPLWYPELRRSNLSFQVVMDTYDEAVKSGKENPISLVDAAIEMHRINLLGHFNNLLGSHLLEEVPGQQNPLKVVANAYYANDASEEDRFRGEKERNDAVRIFRFWIENLKEGWLEVIPYNDNLAFLKSEDGEYDFVIRGQRDREFNHNPYYPHLLNGDVPKSHSAGHYHFLRWLYFNYDGWLENDEHEAEKAHYASGGTTASYPGGTEILKNHLVRLGKYQELQKSKGKTAGFERTNIDGYTLYVSNLISIGEFKRFMEENPDYASNRILLPRQANQKAKQTNSSSHQIPDCWESVNADEDDSLPASVTWCDANAFASWISKRKGLPVRLLKESEHLSIASSAINPVMSPDEFYHHGHDRICRFYSLDGAPIDGHPPYMEESEFQALQMRYIPEALKWSKPKEGLTFLVSSYFGEWLDKFGAAVNCATLSALLDPPATPYRAPFSQTSTGKYKSMKIGFRLCYLGKA